MPIKGISDVVRLPRLGKIRLGVREEAGEDFGYPLPTDYFVCPEEVRKVFGERPRELRIMFPTEDESQWAGQHLKCYSPLGELVCRGDGETAIARVDTRTGELITSDTAATKLQEVNCLPEVCSYYQRKQCRRVMNLQFLLPECPGFGVYQLDTSSYHSIVNINSMLQLIRGTCQRISMIPLTLRLMRKEVQPEGDWKSVYVLDLSTECSLLEMQEYSRIPPGQVLLVPTPDNEAPDDLFPDDVLRRRVPGNDASNADIELRLVWNRAKSMIRGLDIRESQIADWFWRSYQCRVNLDDFDRDAPPEKLTIERLRRFCNAVERHSSQS
jgi:hypothetical protein